MKKVEVIFDAVQLAPLIQGLSERYLYGFTLSRVSYGFDMMERGFKLEMVVRAGLVPEVLDLFNELNIPMAGWKERGFGPDILDVEDAVRIRTGEEGNAALLYLC